jgi:hypothetical protein
MESKKYFPRSDAEFNTYQEAVSVPAIENYQLYGLPSQWLMNDFVPAKTRWVAGWGAWQNPATRTRVITTEKNDSRKAYEPLVRQIVKMLQVSPTVTPEALALMNIPLPDRNPTPAPKPQTYVELTFETSFHRIIIHFRDQNSPSKAKPFGMHGVEIKSGILDTPPAEAAALSDSSFATRTPFEMNFPESLSGKTIYITARWENTRGEKGPWSKIQAVVIP